MTVQELVHQFAEWRAHFATERANGSPFCGYQPEISDIEQMMALIEEVPAQPQCAREVEEARDILQCLFPLHRMVLEQNENMPDNGNLGWTIDLGTLRRASKFILSVTRPDELGREITDEMVERGARAHCPFAFEGNSDAVVEMRAEASNEVRAILTAALSVSRPECCGGADAVLVKALTDIKQATLEGRVCDDVAWFDQITTLHDFCEHVLSQVPQLARGPETQKGPPHP